MTKCDWAWLAGIVDGEGTISAGMERLGPRSLSPYLVVYVSVTNTNPFIPKRCLKITKLGGIYYHKLNHRKWKDWSRWVVRGEGACVVAERIMPYLVSKRRQANLLLSWRNMERFVGRHAKGLPAVSKHALSARKKLCRNFRLLNKRGKM